MTWFKNLVYQTLTTQGLTSQTQTEQISASMLEMSKRAWIWLVHHTIMQEHVRSDQNWPPIPLRGIPTTGNLITWRKGFKNGNKWPNETMIKGLNANEIIWWLKNVDAKTFHGRKTTLLPKNTHCLMTTWAPKDLWIPMEWTGWCMSRNHHITGWSTSGKHITGWSMSGNLLITGWSMSGKHCITDSAPSENPITEPTFTLWITQE